MIFILFGEGEEVDRVYRLSKRECREEVRRGVSYNSILAMEIHFISTSSTSIAFDIFFIQ